MTKFESEIAYRILKARQHDLIIRAGELSHEKALLGSQGILNLWSRIWREQEINSLLDRADSLWPVLDYLRMRIEEEQHDAV